MSDERKTKAYRNVTGLVKGMVNFLCRIDSSQLSQVPDQGPLIIVINHINFLDVPALYTRLMPRRLTGFVKDKEWKNWFTRGILSQWGGIPLFPGEPNIEAFKTGLRMLADGYILAVAPEGIRSEHGRLQRGEPGAALRALRSRVSVRPVVMYKHERFWKNLRCFRRTDMEFAVGKHFCIDVGEKRINRKIRQQITDEIMFQMARLLPEHNRGIYSDLTTATEDFLRFSPG
ncbi:MAG: 1-acyl-sn-glycerol-3-phosphate acyltransferase [Anaerolineaceae bacterium]|nr:1-acyl-sn-glycerol-3-phosphate acyltransferase [Anaerolineaceae bacterium]